MQLGVRGKFLIARVTLGLVFVLAPSMLSAQGVAFGTQPDFSNFRDSLAVLRGTWGADQTATATVHTVNQQSGDTFEEVELLLRFSIGAGNAKGYEVLFSCRPEGSQYVQIVRWNGPPAEPDNSNHAFDLLDGIGQDPTSPRFLTESLVDGAQVKATIEGNRIRAYINNVQVLEVFDSSYASGSPGMGFYRQGGTPEMNADYGFTNYSATSPATSRVYTTSFSSTENPISESGNWINGKATGVDWNNVRTTAPAATATPFDSFTAKLEIERSRRPTLRGADSFEVAGRGVLGDATHGIAPNTEIVTLGLGPFSLTIPAGSFVKKTDRTHDRDGDWDGGDWDHDRDRDRDRDRGHDKDRDWGREGGKKNADDPNAEYVFKGVIAGVSLDARIEKGPNGKFRFSFEGRNAALVGVVNPVGPAGVVKLVTVGLAIGDDLGSDIVRAHIR